MPQVTKTPLFIACFSLFTVSPALAERPSINQLNAAVNQLEAENNAQQEQIDALLAASAGALHVYDREGTDLGVFAGRYGSANDANFLFVFREESGLTIPVLYTGVLDSVPDLTVYFAEPECAGTAVFAEPVKHFKGITASQVYVHTRLPGPRFFVPRSGPIETTNNESYLLTNSGCINLPQTLTTVPVDEITEADLGITFPVPVPLSLGLPPAP